MSSDVLSGVRHRLTRTRSKNFSTNTEKSQEAIYQFLLEQVRTHSPEAVLLEFQHLFLNFYVHPGNAEVMQELADLMAANKVEDFINTIKRCCYILINNWETKRNYDIIQELISGFSNLNLARKSTSSFLVNRQRSWLKVFLESKDYQDLRLFVSRHNTVHLKNPPSARSTQHWSHRYTSFLLVPQYANTNNPQEQREAAKTLSNHLKKQFKFDLAMYTAHSQEEVEQPQQNQDLSNPTTLGENALRLIKKIVAKQGIFSYSNLASIFVKQTRDISYKHFKEALKKYLINSSQSEKQRKNLEEKLSEKISALYQERDEDRIDDAIVLRTCNRLFDCLTIEIESEPSEVFALFMFQGHPMTLVVILLKLILICPQARVHLEKRIAELISYYMDYPEEECQWVLSFFEIFKIAFAIYADNDVQYNLIRVEAPQQNNQSQEAVLENYRIFSQQKRDLDIDVNQQI